VPFPVREDEFCYYTTFSLPVDFIKDRVLLNFGAVDQIATVYIDEKLVGTHKGGYTPFSFDITDFLADDRTHGTATQHELRVDIIDHLDHKFPYGKQKKNRGGMWYTPVSGIWQTVWLESVPEKYIRGIKITPDLEGIALEVDGDDDEYTVQIKSRSNEKEQTFNLSEKSFYIKIDNPKLWSPESPELYDITIQGSQDKVQSYFALRTVGIGCDDDGYQRLLLNGKPYFFNGVLDQGYWPQGIFLPNSEQGWEDDILAMKKLGFNTLRKHIKIEPAGFYEACDRLGMVVFQDFINNADYSFFHDTILPTIFGATSSFITGKNKLFDDRHFHKSAETRRIFKQTVTDTINHLYNFPCICYYTIFNEGWGQFCADEMYDFVKELDSTRIIDSTSGWFKQKKSDVESDHIYFKKIKIKKSEKPIVISEFGGYSFKLEPNHYFNKKQNYGYRFFKDQSELEKAIHELYDTQIKPYVKKGLCASIYTQLSDVEDETNGFLTYDRIAKVKSSFEIKL
jgi:beta-galactosidase/beta-glucuronidase